MKPKARQVSCSFRDKTKSFFFLPHFLSLIPSIICQLFFSLFFPLSTFSLCHNPPPPLLPPEHTYTFTQTLSLRDGLCLSISLQWPSYKAGVWRLRPAADAAVDWPFISSLQTVLNSHQGGADYSWQEKWLCVGRGCCYIRLSLFSYPLWGFYSFQRNRALIGKIRKNM